MPLQESDIILRSYSGHDVSVIGESTVHVRYNAQEAHLPVIITKGDGVALMGRNWLSTLKLNCKQYPALFDGK